MEFQKRIKIMTKRIKILLITMILAVMSLISTAQIPDEIIMSLKTGNSVKLSGYFNQNVELVVLENENVYSKSHAQQVINNFFKKNPPVKFSIIHQGGKGDSNYAIGTLETQNGSFRVYFLIKTVNQAPFIHQLRIEKQTE